MDELRNGFQKPLVQEIIECKGWGYQPKSYEKRNVCSRYDRQMNKSRVKEYLEQTSKGMSIVIDD